MRSDHQRSGVDWKGGSLQFLWKNLEVSGKIVIPQQVGIAVPAEAWGTDVLTLTDEQQAELKALADNLIG